MDRAKHKMISIYDDLVWIMLIWCVFQEIVLSFLLNITGNVSFVKVLFFSKDVMMILLFMCALFNLKFNSKMLICFVLYYIIVALQTLNGIVSFPDKSMTSLLSSVRGLILLPTMMIIGFSIRDKYKFIQKIKKYYLFLTIVAVIGLLEYLLDNLIGTEKFWMDFIGLGNFHTIIKGQPDLLYDGVPWNWHTSGSDGNPTQNRFISIWAGPLTAAFVLLMPCMYYTINYIKNRKFVGVKLTMGHLRDFALMVICIVSLCMTYTRQIILPYIALTLFCIVYYNKKNRKFLIIGGTSLLLFFIIACFPKICDYIYNGSTVVHIQQILSSLQHMKFLGSGVGSFGTRFADSYATESQYLTVMGQIGVMTLILYLIIMIYPIVYCIKHMKDIDGYSELMIFSICLSGIAFTLAGMVSETVAAFTSIAQYYVFIGMSWGYCIESRRECIKDGDKINCNVFTSVSQNS